MWLAVSKALLCSQLLLGPAQATGGSDLDFAILNRRNDYLTDHPPLRFFAMSSDPDCHYDDYQYCNQEKESALVKIHAKSQEGAHIDGNHVHYENPSNVNHGLRISNRPHFQRGDYDLGRSKNGHYNNGQIGAQAEPDTDESSYFTNREHIVPGEVPAKDMSYSVHHYDGGNRNVYYREWVPRFEPPGE